MSHVYRFNDGLRLRQTERKLAPWREVLEKPPKRGWIRTVREGLGMSAIQLAGRLGFSRQGLADLERREREGAVTLAALSKAANAMGCELVYAIVPRSGLSELVESQARDRAEMDVKKVSHTMRLEAQDVPPEETEHLIRQRVANLLSNDRRKLWDIGTSKSTNPQTKGLVKGPVASPSKGKSRGAADR